MKEFDIDTCTLQEAMDYAVQKIVQQGKRCMMRSTISSCMYADGNGNHCAVGWLMDHSIKHDYFDPLEYEGDVEDLIRQHRSVLPQLVIDNPKTFIMFQNFHDAPDAYSREDIRRALHDTFNINTSAPHWHAWVALGKQDVPPPERAA